MDAEDIVRASRDTSGETVAPTDEMPKSAQDIVRALAAATPTVSRYYDGDWECFGCGGSTHPDIDDFVHDPDCPWLIAREWVEAAASGPPPFHAHHDLIGDAEGDVFGDTPKRVKALELGPPDPEDDHGPVWLTRFVAPLLPMPPDCLFQLAPDGDLVVRFFRDGSVEFGEGITVGEAAGAFWLVISTLAGRDERASDG